MSLICNVQIGYGANTALKALSEEDYQRLRKTYPSFELPEDRDKMYSYVPYTGVEFLSDLKMLSDMNIEFSISRIRGQFVEREDFKTALHGSQTSIVNVSIPNAGMFGVQTVHYMEDACTDWLQKFLHLGWRILAVCPPNDTRRPTYIIGHPDKDPNYP